MKTQDDFYRVTTEGVVSTPDDGKKVTVRGLLCVLGAWSILLIIGAQLSWGNMSTYFASYFYWLGKDVTMEQFYTVQPLIVVTATFFFPFGMHLTSRYSTRL